MQQGNFVSEFFILKTQNPTYLAERQKSVIFKFYLFARVVSSRRQRSDLWDL